jgi:photosystem II stability/assembly factor-like uncharacterized protein
VRHEVRDETAAGRGAPLVKTLGSGGSDSRPEVAYSSDVNARVTNGIGAVDGEGIGRRSHRSPHRTCAVLFSAMIGVMACSSSIDHSSQNSQAVDNPVRTDIIQAVAFNSQVAVAGTQTGAILVSSNAGKFWRRTELGHLSVIGLAVCPNGNFVAIDFYHTVWTGNPDGSRWIRTSFRADWNPLAVTCDSTNRWWVVGTNASIATSVDEGATWSNINLKQDLHLTAIQFPSHDFGIAMGEFGTVATTHDSGLTWSRQAPIPGDFYPYSLLFVDDKTGYVSGVAGQTLRTADGGTSWQMIDNATGMPLYRLFLHQGRPWAVGAVGTIATLEDSRWVPAAYPKAAPVSLGAGTSVGALGIVVGGPGGLLRMVSPTVTPSAAGRIAVAGLFGAGPLLAKAPDGRSRRDHTRSSTRRGVAVPQPKARAGGDWLHHDFFRAGTAKASNLLRFCGPVAAEASLHTDL